MASVFTPGGWGWWGGRLLVIGGIDFRLAHWLPGKLAEGHAPHHPFDNLSRWKCSDLKVRTITSWDLGQVCRTVSQVMVQVKQALVEQGMYREQENSHLVWPDHTLPNLGKIIILKIFQLSLYLSGSHTNNYIDIKIGIRILKYIHVKILWKSVIQEEMIFNKFIYLCIHLLSKYELNIY